MVTELRNLVLHFNVAVSGLSKRLKYFMMEWPAKDTLISLKSLAFEKRMDLLPMNHWHSEENS